MPEQPERGRKYRNIIDELFEARDDAPPKRGQGEQRQETAHSKQRQETNADPDHVDVDPDSRHD